MRSVVFLDVDGVLNSTRSVLAKSGPKPIGDALWLLKKADGELPYGPAFTIETIDSVAVALVNRLIRKSGALLVLSTSHRNMFLKDGDFKSPRHMRMLGLYFEALGIEAPIHDITPKLYIERGREVLKWQEENRWDFEVDKCVILDDGRDFLKNQPLVWCDPAIGFTAANYFEAANLLGVEESAIIF